mgnify:CR=1 FL=1
MGYLTGFLLVLKAEVVRAFIVMRRYWFASVIGIIMGYGTLITLVYGLMHTPTAVKEMAEKAINGILGFLIGVFAFGIVGLFSQGLQGMARTGELEQVCLSPYGLVTNFLARSFVAAVGNIISSAIMLILVATTVAESLHVAPIETLVLLGLTYINLIGFGFMVGGLVLVFKQTGQVAVIVRFAMIGLAIFATEKVYEWPWMARWVAHALPVTDAAICLKYTLIQGQQAPLINEAGERVVCEIQPALDAAGQPLVDAAGHPMLITTYDTVFSSVFMHESFFFLIISCVIWNTIGIALFRFMENWSRDKGTLGAY